MEISRPLYNLSRSSKALRASPRALSQLLTRQRPFHHSAVAQSLRIPLRSGFTTSKTPPLNALRPSTATSLPRPSPSSLQRSKPFSTSFPRSQPLTEDPPPSPSPPAASQDQSPPPPERRDVPAYELTLTCKPCLTRATHRISKQGYHHGTVLITCPSCKARHLISDHLKIFKDQSTTIEDILREKGDAVTKGTLGDAGDIEFWEDGTVTKRENSREKGKDKEKAQQLA